MENLGNIVGVLIYAYDFLLDSPDSRLFSRARSQGFPSLQVSRTRSLADRPNGINASLLPRLVSKHQ
jgi:hypothetical protein